MVFSDTTTKNGLIQDCEITLFNEYGRISGNADLLAEFTFRLNRSMDKAIEQGWDVDGRWATRRHNSNHFTDLQPRSPNGCFSVPTQ